ncbi:MAG TPA: serine hydrolase [Bryobacteraceae bacterium]|nr:serine hydrolase [Bryobacteraceae bacterium]
MTTLAICLALLITPVSMPAQAPDEWPVSTPADEGLNPDTLSRLDNHIRAELPHLRSMLIARHGHLVFEKYYGDASRDELHNMQSMTKSVSSALAGIALKKGLIKSLDCRAVDYFPEYQRGIQDERFNRLTIRQLLTMSSGLDELGFSFDKAFADPVAEILKQHLLFAPGQGFKYSSPAAHLLGGVLRKAAGQSVLAFAETELFRPLGMGEVVWYADKTGLQSGGMSGLWRSRDLLKLGELYLRQGRWRGREIIPQEYVADSVKVHNAGDFFGGPVRYGYMWFITFIGSHQAFYAAGYGGQYMMVVPDADLVVICTSDWRQPEYPAHFGLVQRFILPAVAAK